MKISLNYPVSIVIPTLNEAGYLPTLLDSLGKIKTPLDIIVVDGNSEDETVKVVENFQQFFSGQSSLRLLHSEKRCISFQRNLGAKNAQNNIIMFCDADIMMCSAIAFENMIIEFLENKYLAAAPVLVPIESRADIRLVYKSLIVIQKICLMCNRPYFAGCCLLTTKEAFIKVGGFNENLLLAEDVDYSVRVNRLGKCGLLKINVPVSARRILKYGYRWIFKDTPNLIRLIFTGKLVNADKIFYPFGDYGATSSIKSN